MFSRLVVVAKRTCISRGFAVSARLRSAAASSAAPGTVLKGLNIYKEGKDPVALKDDEYPEGLWTLLDEVPEDAMAEKERQRLQRSRIIKESNFMKSKKK
ncbi:hypothetical protein LPJ56_003526 [Coemansia sp. RSA 2599]|nr:hypothetical protein LPJ56_003526 [Coemansia sp. RSA 2599]